MVDVSIAERSWSRKPTITSSQVLGTRTQPPQMCSGGPYHAVSDAMARLAKWRRNCSCEWPCVWIPESMPQRGFQRGQSGLSKRVVVSVRERSATVKHCNRRFSQMQSPSPMTSFRTSFQVWVRTLGCPRQSSFKSPFLRSWCMPLQRRSCGDANTGLQTVESSNRPTRLRLFMCRPKKFRKYSRCSPILVLCISVPDSGCAGRLQ